MVQPRIMTTSDGLRSYNPQIRQCYFQGERYLRFFQVYTQRNCEVECLTNFTFTECGCVGLYMPSNVISFALISSFKMNNGWKSKLTGSFTNSSPNDSVKFLFQGRKRRLYVEVGRNYVCRRH